MKKLILLLFIPLVSFSQTFDDLMGIDSKEKFIRTMVEIGFERMSAEEGLITYAYSPTYEDESEPLSSLWVYHFEQEDEGGVVYLQIQTKDFFGSEENSEYNKIFDVVKEKCEYAELIENPFVEGDEMVSYGCEWEDTVRMIAFSKKDGEGSIAYMYVDESVLED
jgi:hypothetical protein|tara:strand:+ start:176 stop:670 length:495 start_codon:yes stop_codon:yes gene_type:complete